MVGDKDKGLGSSGNVRCCCCDIFCTGSTGEGVEVADDKEELADMFSSANSIRSSKISSDSPANKQKKKVGFSRFSSYVNFSAKKWIVFMFSFQRVSMYLNHLFLATAFDATTEIRD